MGSAGRADGSFDKNRFCRRSEKRREIEASGKRIKKVKFKLL